MTKLPHPDWNVKPYDGKPYRVGPYCSVPGCRRIAEHAHHIWRRSFTGRKGTPWVVLWDGKIVGNLTGLCVEHHDQVTGGLGGHEAAIVYDDGVFLWETKEWHAALDPQPPLGTPLEAAPAGQPEVSERSTERGVCPTCGKVTRPRQELPPGERRPKKTWSITVPVDERENGAEVIDTLLEHIAEKLGRAGHKSWKYYSLVEALAFTTQHLHMLDESGKDQVAT